MTFLTKESTIQRTSIYTNCSTWNRAKGDVAHNLLNGRSFAKSVYANPFTRVKQKKPIKEP